jgi:potassium efflux system protein
MLAWRHSWMLIGWICLYGFFDVAQVAGQNNGQPSPTEAASAPENPFRPPARLAELPSDRRTASRSAPLIRSIIRSSALPTSAEVSPTPTAVTDTSSSASKPTALTKEHIARQFELVSQASDLDEATKADLLRRLQEANEFLKQSEEATSKAAQFAVEIQQAPQLFISTKAMLAQPVMEIAVVAPANQQLVQIEQQLTQAETRLNEAKAELADLEAELKKRPERYTELRKQVSETAKRLEDLQKQVAAPPPSGVKPIVAEVRKMQQEAEQLGRQRQLEQLRLELQRIDALAELVPLQRDVAKRNVLTVEKEVGAWQKIVADVRKAESKRQAVEARRQVENTDPALREVAVFNAELAEKRKAIASSIERAAAESQQLTKQLADLDNDFKKLQEKVQIAGLSKTIGILLRKQRADLHTSGAPRVRIRFIERELPLAQLALIELEEERSKLGDLEQSVQDVIASLSTSVPERDRQMVAHTASELLATKRELLDKSIYDYNAYLKELGELELSCRKLITETTAYSDFVDKHVLWIRSAEPFSSADFQRIGHSLVMWSNAKMWLEMGEKTFAGLARRPVQGVLALVLVLTLVVMRRRMFNRLDTLCNADSGNNVLNFLTTLEAMSLVFIASSVWPCLMWCAGWWLDSSYDATEFSNAIAAGLQRGAAFFWLLQLVRVSTRGGGIGEMHFGWHASGTKVVRENLFWLGVIGIPISIAVTVVDRWDDGQGNDSLGRFAFIVGMVLTATAMHNLFRHQKGMLQEALARTPTGWLNRVRIAGYTTGTGIPCVLAVLAAAGYYYSARQLAIRFELTMLIALGLMVMHGVLTRWFLVKRRNISIRQARERRSQEQPADNKGVVAAPLPAQDLTKIQSQLQYLLRYGAILAVLVMTWYVWADVLPALRILDRVVLWTSRVAVMETVSTVSGEHSQSVEQDVPTTLTHVLLATLIAAGTYVLGKNLPGLLEITVLERLPIDHGGRHALSIILRYIVFLAGLLFVGRTLSVSWSSVQWLAAAMTVGLGFGLQEIFANLVSGLIILFERPIRVGDLVTVNGVTGTVSRMQIRATTITDFDRREMIVPNKKFITEDVINWTLSDQISRVTIEVGVAYGSDTALAHSILLRLANEHPLVMRDPAPMAIFKKFGESTLDFSLHIFIATRSVYAAVVHDLHTWIDREFRLASIEMAFPQRDVNIRSINSDLLPMVAGMPKAKAA